VISGVSGDVSPSATREPTSFLSPTLWLLVLASWPRRATGEPPGPPRRLKSGVNVRLDTFAIIDENATTLSDYQKRIPGENFVHTARKLVSEGGPQVRNTN